MTNKFCILQVDDDRNDWFFLEHAFRSVGITYPLQIARDGQEAIDYLSGTTEFADRRRFPLPCLVLLDLKMPRKDGFEVLAWIRKHSDLGRLTVIMFSSSRHEHDIDRAYGLGANSFLVKPSKLQERLELANHIKGYWLHFHQMVSPCSDLLSYASGRSTPSTSRPLVSGVR
jgi:CheY-like chemotaxis protein